MCAEYETRTNQRKIEERLGVALPDIGTVRFNQGKRVKFTVAAPVIAGGLEGPVLTEKVFPVSPFPNARLSGLGLDEDAGDLDQDIRRIYEVPLWKKSFSENPVLVPMTSFFEPVYWGSQIGTVQKFSVPDEEIFFVAGMLIKPRTPKLETLGAFSLITHTATSQMMRYHQRLVTILKPDIALKYLEPMDPQTRFNFLIENRYAGELDVEKDRAMAKGWEKRVSQQEAKLKREEAYISALKREKISG